ncbi:MAG: tRNA pseudouridine(38-40) synthase TruA [Sporolactobacillus sp.]
MMNYKLTIQYDGGRYKGWQRLGDTEDTIQGKIERSLTELEGHTVEIIGSSRTDAGVHALAQIANVKLSKPLTAAELKRALNQSLPQDISVCSAEAVPERFHARYHAKRKTYLYKIWNKDYSNPFMRKYSMSITTPLDMARMRDASHYFIGTHDFTAYSNAKSKKKNAVRTIDTLTIEEKDGLIQIRVGGNGFLYNMVRKIVGTLIEVGLKEIEASAVPDILEAQRRDQTGLMADARGLYLEKIDF